MATVRQRASGSWQVIVQVRQPNGRRRQESRTFPTEAEARTYAHKLEYDVRSGDMPADRATIRQLADAWIQRGRHTKPSSHSAYRHALAKAVAELGDIEARRLTPSQCEQAWARLLDRYKPNYVRQARATLATVLDWAIRDGIIARNPARISTIPTARQRGTLNQSAVPTADELDAILAARDRQPWPVMWRLLADTGLRHGEARALRWRDINLDGGTLNVRATRTRTPTGEQDGEPKSPQSRRTVPLTAAARDALARHRTDTAALHGLAAVRKDSYVFHGPLEQWHVTEAWKRMAAETGLRAGLTPHSLRHGFASTMLAEGVALTRVAALCGHTVNVCARTYAHWIGDVDHGAIEILERSRQLRAVD